MSGKTVWTALVLGVMAFPSTAMANEHYEYYLTGHNHYGEAVFFSCNGGTPRRIENGGSRTVNFHGGENVHANCVATHDGEAIWNGSLHMSHDQPNGSLEITNSANHDDDGDHN